MRPALGACRACGDGVGRVATAKRRVSVVIAAYADDRWDNLVALVDSLAAQTVRPAEVIVVVDHNVGLLTKVQAELPGIAAIQNEGARGASAARNAGAALATGDVLAFVDDDVIVEADWLEKLVERCGDADVIGVGGRILPAWTTHRPAWFPAEFDWVVGATYRGMPENAGPVRNVWSGNMAILRSTFHVLGGFRAGFGKEGGASRPEDTELCVRAHAHWPRKSWLYEPEAVVHHKVPRQRETFSFFAVRCFHEGVGKAELSALSGHRAAMSAEHRYVRSVLTRALARELVGALKEPARMSRAVAIVLGLACAAVGHLVGLTQRRRSHRRRHSDSFGSVEVD